MNELKILRKSGFEKIFERNYDGLAPFFENKKIYYPNDDLEVDEIPIKKHKGTNQISTRAFDEGNDKIYHQHYNYSHAKNIIIDCVNDDCLAEIFTYLPACERPKLALVCKRWQKALDYAGFKVKKVELIYWQFEENPRGLKKYPTIHRELCFLKSLLDKCGRYLTKLDLTAYCHCNIVPVINNSCPNLVNLRLRFTYIDDVILFNAFTRLSKLEVLTIIFQNINNKLIPVTLINSLRNIANTLTHLSLLNFMHDPDSDPFYELPTEIDCVIPELKALEKFEVAGIRLPEMSCYNSNTLFYVQKSIYQLNDCKKLNLSNHQVTDNALYVIANVMEQLKILCISCELVTDDGIVAISKMNNLQILNCFGHNSVTDSSVKLLKNLIKLWLPSSNKITDDSIIKVLENSPKMEELYVEGTGVTVEFIKKAADISKNRERVLHVAVTFIPHIKQYESRNYDGSATSFKRKMILYPNDDLEIDEIPIKKHKATNQISTCSFDEENDEIDNQHNDHSYAKNIIIDCVNDDCLAEIFTYLSACERPKLALVCKRWKKALDYVGFKVKKVELIYWQFEENPRGLKKYPTIHRELCFLKSLLDKCGRYLTKLDLTAYNHCNILPVINNYCPNLLPCSAKITDDSVTKVLENSPDMEDLYAEYTSVTVEFIKKAAGISKNRKQRLRIGVTFIPDIKQYESQYFTIKISQKKEQVPRK
ncbi:uncharacterized protein LOC122851108 [Aphidius gifuensis]|uniref:uncharacterized protein LOC122851108 n=1 Tax=Aphidius gifuensis TaxID=684658 RepID=UPI001CDBDCC6|nr:uncharacterized protein LOC122851108 [Aphidius gifuensis]